MLDLISFPMSILVTSDLDESNT